MNLLDKETITVLLADDHSLIRQGIMFILEEIEVDAKVIQASNLQQITEQINKDEQENSPSVSKQFENIAKELLKPTYASSPEDELLKKKKRKFR